MLWGKVGSDRRCFLTLDIDYKSALQKGDKCQAYMPRFTMLCVVSLWISCTQMTAILMRCMNIAFPFEFSKLPTKDRGSVVHKPCQ